MLHLLCLNRAAIREHGFGIRKKFRPIAQSNLAQPKLLSRAFCYSRIVWHQLWSSRELSWVDIISIFIQNFMCRLTYIVYYRLLKIVIWANFETSHFEGSCYLKPKYFENQCSSSSSFTVSVSFCMLRYSHFFHPTRLFGTQE